jgi:hypothetical protein
MGKCRWQMAISRKASLGRLRPLKTAETTSPSSSIQIKSDRVYIPAFTVVSNPTVKLKDLKTRKFNVMGRQHRKHPQVIPKRDWGAPKIAPIFTSAHGGTMKYKDLKLKKFNILNLIRKRSADYGKLREVPRNRQLIPKRAKKKYTIGIPNVPQVKDIKTLDELNKLFGGWYEHE